MNDAENPFTFMDKGAIVGRTFFLQEAPQLSILMCGFGNEVDARPAKYLCTNLA
jgi:hypothetical protein